MHWWNSDMAILITANVIGIDKHMFHWVFSLLKFTVCDETMMNETNVIFFSKV